MVLREASGNWSRYQMGGAVPFALASSHTAPSGMDCLALETFTHTHAREDGSG